MFRSLPKQFARISAAALCASVGLCGSAFCEPPAPAQAQGTLQLPAIEGLIQPKEAKNIFFFSDSPQDLIDYAEKTCSSAFVIFAYIPEEQKYFFPDPSTRWKEIGMNCPRILLICSKQGAFSIPGGKREPGESVLETAQREFAEETGFELEPPLTWDDAAVFKVRDESRNWVVFFRKTSDLEQFNAAVRSAPNALYHPFESVANVAYPVYATLTKDKKSLRPSPISTLIVPHQRDMALSVFDSRGIITPVPIETAAAPAANEGK